MYKLPPNCCTFSVDGKAIDYAFQYFVEVSQKVKI